MLRDKIEFNFIKIFSKSIVAMTAVEVFSAYTQSHWIE